MELITEIYEEHIGYAKSDLEKLYKVRKASRAVLFNSLNQIAFPFVSKNMYHKLPGGGIEKGESIIEALNREVMEEVGAKIDIISEIGTIIEYRDRFKQLQISYCFLAKVKEIVDSPSFTKEELDAGFQLKWMKFEDAIATIENDKPTDYMGKFIQKRDLAFLTKAKEIIGKEALAICQEK
ncbi:NUDIX domain-containing protein [Clostridium algoriphilum]|uniref:NUDIX domain-containing protein n=1 Tax=Clostridium algoriphilum TaxID=198347 RepID=UPI001CF32F54|nr:NUDIX domain-containing protein [Clostridium algoriphilum]MCB2294060.1 NUDIX domain-containing protein [Clostridium algoriphilum]